MGHVYGPLQYEVIYTQLLHKYNIREPVSSPRDAILIKDSLVDLYRISLTRPVPSRVPIYTVISLYVQHFVSDEDPNGYTRISVLVWLNFTRYRVRSAEYAVQLKRRRRRCRESNINTSILPLLQPQPQQQSLQSHSFHSSNLLAVFRLYFLQTKCSSLPSSPSSRPWWSASLSLPPTCCRSAPLARLALLAAMKLALPAAPLTYECFLLKRIYEV